MTKEEKIELLMVDIRAIIESSIADLERELEFLNMTFSEKAKDKISKRVDLENPKKWIPNASNFINLRGSIKDAIHERFQQITTKIYKDINESLKAPEDEDTEDSKE